jgi:hypothetical protein
MKNMKATHLHSQRLPGYGAYYSLTVTCEDGSTKTHKGVGKYITRLIREYKKANKSLVLTKVA